MARSCTSAAGCSALYSCGGDGVLLEWPGADSLTSDSVQPTNISSVVDGTPNAAPSGAQCRSLARAAPHTSVAPALDAALPHATIDRVRGSS
jgi:hypothetical protein